MVIPMFNSATLMNSTPFGLETEAKLLPREVHEREGGFGELEAQAMQVPAGKGPIHRAHQQRPLAQ